MLVLRYCRCLHLCVCMSVSVCQPWVVRTISRHLLKLESPHLDHKYKNISLVTYSFGASWSRMFHGLHHLHILPPPPPPPPPHCFTVPTVSQSQPSARALLGYVLFSAYTYLGGRGYLGVNIALVVFDSYNANVFPDILHNEDVPLTIAVMVVPRVRGCIIQMQYFRLFLDWPQLVWKYKCDPATYPATRHHMPPCRSFQKL